MGLWLTGISSRSWAQDCPPDAVGCHRADIDFEHLDMRLPSVSLDSGWVPASSPIQVRFGLRFMGETEVELGGTLATYWPFGLTLTTPGRPGQGHLRMAWGLEITARMRFSADIGGTHYEWEGDIPFVPLRDLRLAGEAVFDPFVLPGAMPRPASVRDTTGMVRLFAVGLSSIVGPSIPGLDGGFAVTLAGDLTTRYQTDRILIEDARAPIDREGAVVQYWPPPDGLGGSRDIVVRPEGTLVYDGDVIVRPNVYVELLGRRFELAGFDVPAPVVRTTTSTMFVPVTVHVPLPDAAVAPTNLDAGALRVGDVATESLTIRNRGEAELTVAVGATPGTLAVSSARVVVPAASEATILVTLAPEAAGMLSETLTLRTNDPDLPVVRVPVSAEVMDVVAADAGRTDAGRTDAAALVSDADAGALTAPVAGGCGCRAASTVPRSALAMFSSLVLLLALRRRHRLHDRARIGRPRGSRGRGRAAPQSMSHLD
jgi:MYXO-CTERM domain-containing protein